MKYRFSDSQSEMALERIHRHEKGTENLKSRTLICHFCEHKAIVAFEDSRGHVKVKCKKCGRESIYNVAMPGNGIILHSA